MVGFPHLCSSTGRIRKVPVLVEMIWSKLKKTSEEDLFSNNKFDVCKQFASDTKCKTTNAFTPISIPPQDTSVESRLLFFCVVRWVFNFRDRSSKALSGPLFSSRCAGVCGGELTGSFFVKNRASGDCAVMAKLTGRPNVGVWCFDVRFMAVNTC